MFRFFCLQIAYLLGLGQSRRACLLLLLWLLKLLLLLLKLLLLKLLLLKLLLLKLLLSLLLLLFGEVLQLDLSRRNNCGSVNDRRLRWSSGSRRLFSR